MMLHSQSRIQLSCLKVRILICLLIWLGAHEIVSKKKTTTGSMSNILPFCAMKKICILKCVQKLWQYSVAGLQTVYCLLTLNYTLCTVSIMQVWLLVYRRHNEEQSRPSLPEKVLSSF